MASARVRTIFSDRERLWSRCFRRPCSRHVWTTSLAALRMCWSGALVATQYSRVPDGAVPLEMRQAALGRLAGLLEGILSVLGGPEDLVAVQLQFALVGPMSWRTHDRLQLITGRSGPPLPRRPSITLSRGRSFGSPADSFAAAR